MTIRIRSDEIVTVCGRRKFGKTTFAKHILGAFDRRRVYDPNGEYVEFEDRFVPHSSEPYEPFFDDCWRSGNLELCVDEADKVWPLHKPLRGAFYNIVHLGAHRNLGLIAITRRVANLHKDVFSQSNHVFIFSQFIKGDIEYLQDCGVEDAEKVRKLPRWWCYYWNPETTEMILLPPLELPTVQTASAQGAHY
jgi:hypothetical protein